MENSFENLKKDWISNIAICDNNTVVKNEIDELKQEINRLKKKKKKKRKIYIKEISW